MLSTLWGPQNSLRADGLQNLAIAGLALMLGRTAWGSELAQPAPAAKQGKGIGAELLLAPLRGAPIPLGPGRVACPERAQLGGWTVGGDGRTLRPPAAGVRSSELATLAFAREPSLCAASRDWVALGVLGETPTIDPKGIVLDVDGGRVVVLGHGLRDAVLYWTTGDKSGSDVCSGQQRAATLETCVFAVPRGLPADPAQISIAILPSGSQPGPRTYAYDAKGYLQRPESGALRPSRVLLSELVPADAAADSQSGSARLPLLHPEAIASVSCQDAFCSIDGRELVVRAEHGGDNDLEVAFTLRPQVYIHHGEALESWAQLELPLNRCAIALAGAAPFVNEPDQAVAIRIGGRCALDASLQLMARRGPLLIERSELLGAARFVLVRLGRSPLDQLSVTLRRSDTIVGRFTAQARPVPRIAATVTLPGVGAIDYIPTDRSAELSAQFVGVSGQALLPLSVEGAYEVTPTASGTYLIRGIPGKKEKAALKFAYRDSSLPPSLRMLTLAVVNETTPRALRAAGPARAISQLARVSTP